MPSEFRPIDGKPRTLFEDPVGTRYFPSLLSDVELGQLDRISADMSIGSVGTRVFDAALQSILGGNSSLMKLACDLVGSEAMAVRAVFFNKTADQNWSTPWHQDRTIPVHAKHERHGYEVWSLKCGIHHVEPPIAVIEKMITLKVHIDACLPNAGPIKVADGSHRMGRVRAADAASVAQTLPMRVCTANAGDVWAMSSTILHASGRSSSAASRRVLHVDFAVGQLPKPLEWFSLY